MPITVPCPSCKAKLKAPEALLGKTVKCPGCKTPVLIKAPAPAAAPAPAPAPGRATPTPPAPKQPVVLDQLEEVDELDEVDEVAEVAELDEVEEVRPGRNGKDRREEVTPAAARRGVREDRPRRDRRREEADEVDEVEEVAEIDEEDEDRPRRKGRGRKSRPGGATDDSERTMAMLVYLLGLLVPFGGLILWLIKRNESRFIDYHGKQHVNVMITSMIAFMACVIPGLILGPIWTVFSIIAAVKAKNGEYYEMPMIFRFIK